MRFALVCDICFEVHWIERKMSLNSAGRAFWKCGKCIPHGGFEGEEE